MKNGTSETIHAPASAITFAAICRSIDAGHCSISFSASDCFSEAMRRMTTNGRSSVIARSYAPSAGVRMPSSGDNPCASAAGPPPIPLASAYAFIAVMKLCPVSNPTISSNNQNARLAASSAISLRTRSRKRKEGLLEPAHSRGQLIERSLGHGAAVIEEEKSVAHARRVAELMNGKDERSPARGVAAQHVHHLTRLAEIESIERFIEQQNRSRNGEADGDVEPLRLS